MASLTVNLPQSRKISVDCDGPSSLIDTPLIQDLVGCIEQLNNRVPVKKVSWKRVGNPADLIYKYSFTLADGRVWSQQIDMKVPTDPLMSFNFPDTFRLTEFVGHRPLRDHILHMCREHAVYKVDVDW